MEDLKADVVVMGSGAAGFGAAVAAAEKGAKVVLMEKRKYFGGISVTAMGIFAVESRLQRLKNVPYTKDEVFKLFMDRTHWMPDAKLVRAYIDKSADTIEWLEDMGVKFQLLDIHTFPGCLNQTGHIVETPDGLKLQGGVTFHMVKAMKDRAEKLGVDIRMGTRVEQIVQDQGRISKVVAQGENGPLEVSTKAVVVAAGGYVHDKEMMAKHGGFELGKDLDVMHNIPLTGEGIRMAWELGAVPDGMSPQLAGIAIKLGLFVDDAKSGASFMGLPRPSILAAAMSPYLWVNPHGVRFVDEGLGNGPYLASAVSRQKNRTSFTIMDSNAKRHLQENGLELNTYMDVMPTKLGDLDNDIQAALAEGNISAQMGESIEELAAKIKINPATLQQTIDAYNACCDKGHDDLFAKNPRFLRPVSTPPFYAFQCSAIGYGTIGGIKINERAEAVDKDCDSIPGLYAAGDCAAGTLTYDYPLVYILWGCTLGFAVNSGRIAGESSAAYIKSLSK